MCFYFHVFILDLCFMFSLLGLLHLPCAKHKRNIISAICSLWPKCGTAKCITSRPTFKSGTARAVPLTYVPTPLMQNQKIPTCRRSRGRKCGNPSDLVLHLPVMHFHSPHFNIGVTTGKQRIGLTFQDSARDEDNAVEQHVTPQTKLLELRS